MLSEPSVMRMSNRPLVGAIEVSISVWCDDRAIRSPRSAAMTVAHGLPPRLTANKVTTRVFGLNLSTVKDLHSWLTLMPILDSLPYFLSIIRISLSSSSAINEANVSHSLKS